MPTLLDSCYYQLPIPYSLKIAVWETLLLSNFALDPWLEGSLLHRIVGSLRTWRSGSALMIYADWIGATLVALVLGFSPFVSTTLIGVLLLACSGFWILLTLSDDPHQESQPLATPIHGTIFLFGVISLIATALSPVKMAALSGLIKLGLYLLFFAFTARLARNPRICSSLITIYLLTSLPVAVYGIRQYFFGARSLATWVDPSSASADVTRVYSYLGNPNLLAGYLLPAVIWGLAAVWIWNGIFPKMLAIVTFAVNSACLVLTYSRGGWIGFVVALTAFGLLAVYWWSARLSPFWQKFALPLTFGVLVALFAIAVLFVPPVRDRVSSIFAGRSDSSNNFRINVWMGAVRMIQAYPIIGIGPGNSAFNKIYPLFMTPKYSALSAYSVLLETAVETGLIGLSIFLWFLAVTFHQGWKNLERLRDRASTEAWWLMGALAIAIGMMAHGAVDTVWYRPQVNTLWWFAVAIISSYYQNIENR
nr:IctB family putative bicarbonate transporter [Roseofilum sp. Guam]